jgi:hypothetical protein
MPTKQPLPRVTRAAYVVEAARMAWSVSLTKGYGFSNRALKTGQAVLTGSLYQGRPHITLEQYPEPRHGGVGIGNLAGGPVLFNQDLSKHGIGYNADDALAALTRLHTIIKAKGQPSENATGFFRLMVDVVQGGKITNISGSPGRRMQFVVFDIDADSEVEQPENKGTQRMVKQPDMFFPVVPFSPFQKNAPVAKTVYAHFTSATDDKSLVMVSQALALYNASLTADRYIQRNGKKLSVYVDLKKGRLRFTSMAGKLLFSGPVKPQTVEKFVESFWFWKKST